MARKGKKQNQRLLETLLQKKDWKIVEVLRKRGSSVLVTLVLVKENFKKYLDVGRDLAVKYAGYLLKPKSETVRDSPETSGPIALAAS